MLTSVDDVIKELGGTAATAELAGVSQPAVSNWRSRRVIPAEYFVTFRDALAAKGKEFPESLFTFVETRA